MNYKKLIIILLILYILYNCFKVREGLIIGKDSYSNEGDTFRKKFCDLIGEKVNKRVNITNFNYNNVHLCKDFTYKNFKDAHMSKCSNKVAGIYDKKNDNYFKNIENIKKIKNKQLFNPDEIITIMNCRLINELNMDDKELRKQFITNIYEDEFSEKEPITNFNILSSYNSSCVYLDDSKEVHDLDQITFLFNFTSGLKITVLSSLLILGKVIFGLYLINWNPGTLVFIVIFKAFGGITLSFFSCNCGVVILLGLLGFGILFILILVIYYYEGF